MNLRKILPAAIIGAVTAGILMMLTQTMINVSGTLSSTAVLIISLVALMIGGFITSYLDFQRNKKLTSKVVSGFLSGVIVMLFVSVLVFFAFLGNVPETVLGLLMFFVIILGGAVSSIGSLVCSFLMGFDSTELSKSLKLTALRENPEMLIPVTGIILISAAATTISGGMQEILIGAGGLIALLILPAAYVLTQGKKLKEEWPNSLKGLVQMLIPLIIIGLVVSAVSLYLGVPSLGLIIMFLLYLAAFVYLLFASFSLITGSLKESINFVKGKAWKTLSLYVILLVIFIAIDFFTGSLIELIAFYGWGASQLLTMVSGIVILSYWINCTVNFHSSLS